ncbi:hypothetical protein PMKS-002877 [Pichia membranifaciens]|uniref:Uncharacterized protein n=1 Tax=Pichia membranifaciens TaxID=4926 RepID=A0A1Q2YIK3_9ASCO|nr:hypothetical protein PMKS-002877 [Pichia membranifaciens]
MSGGHDEKTALDADSLFPPTIKFIKNLTTLDAGSGVSARAGSKNADEEEQRQEAAPTTAKQCSTASDSVFLPLTNARGELEFQLGHAGADGSTPLYHGVQQLTPNSDSVSPNSSSGASTHAKANAHTGVKIKDEFISLSPVSSIKSNNSQDSLNAVAAVAANANDSSVKDSLSDEDDCDDLEDDVPDSEKIHQFAAQAAGVDPDHLFVEAEAGGGPEDAEDAERPTAAAVPAAPESPAAATDATDATDATAPAAAEAPAHSASAGTVHEQHQQLSR